MAEAHEWSIAEVLRRGAEYIVQCYPAEVDTAAEWAPPAARRLGSFRAPPETWRELAWDPDSP